MGGSKASPKEYEVASLLWSLDRGFDFTFLYVIEYDTILLTNWSKSFFSFSNNKFNATFKKYKFYQTNYDEQL